MEDALIYPHFGNTWIHLNITMESCLLCLDLHSESMESIKVNSTQWQELDIENLIRKHFWPLHTIQLSSQLCSTCWEQLHDFDKFYKRIENVHINFDTIMKIEIANDKDISTQQTVETPELIMVEQNIIKEEYDEDLWNDDVPLIQICRNRQVAANQNETKIADPLKASEELENPKTNAKKKSVSNKKIPNETHLAKQIKQKNDSFDFDRTSNSDSDSNIKPDKKTTLARSNLNKEKDKFISENFKLACDICKLPMETFYALSKHFTSEHKQRPYAKCCDKKFFERYFLLDHIHQHLDPDYFKCKDCGKRCTSHGSLKAHSRIHDAKRKKNYCCEVCGLSFYTRNILDEHKTRHLSQEEKLFKCSECGKNFGSNNILKNHIRCIHGPSLACDICGLICVNKFTLNRHKDFKHSEHEHREYTCPICSKISPNRWRHEYHVKFVHQTGYKYKCTTCGKAFKKSQALRQHLAVHTGIPLYTCNWCPKTFNKSSDLSNHRRKYHSKEWEEVVRRKYSTKLPSNNQTPSTSVSNEPTI